LDKNLFLRLPLRALLLTVFSSCFVQISNAEQVVSRSLSFEYDTTTGLLKREIIEPNDSLLKIQTDYQYDGFGNQKEVKITALDKNPQSLQSSTLILRERVSTAGFSVTEPRYPISKTNSLGHEEKFEYDSRWGLKSKHTSANLETQDLAYDVFGRLVTQINRPSPPMTDWIEKKFIFDFNIGTTSLAGNAATSRACITISASGQSGTSTSMPQECSYLNSSNQVVATTTAIVEEKNGAVRLSTMRHEFDALGKKTATTVPFWLWENSFVPRTTFKYDEIGRLAVQIAPNLGATAFQYGPTWTKVIDAKGRIKTTKLNLHGKPLEIVDAKENSLHFRYDAIGNLKRIYDHYGAVTLIDYNNRGEKTQINDPHKGIWVYELNGFGEVLSQTDARGNKTYMEYDSLGRLIKREYPASRGANGNAIPNSGEHVAGWIYDTCRKGFLCETNNGSVGYKKTNTFDQWSRLSGSLSEHGLGAADPRFLESFEYDSFGRLKLKVFPKTNAGSGNNLHRLVALYEYDTAGQPNSVKISSQLSNQNPETIWEKLKVDASGRLTQESLHGKLVKSQFDNEMGWLKGKAVGAASEDYTSDFQRDVLGNLFERTFNKAALPSHPVVKDNFAYDELYRLTNFESNIGTSSVKMEYLANGSLHYKSDVGFYDYGNNGSTPVTSNQVKQIAWQNKSYSSYDANGNLLQVKDITTGTLRKDFRYSAFDQPFQISITGGDPATNGISEFKYGPNLQRIYSKLPDGVNSTLETSYVNGDNSLGLSLERIKRTVAGVSAITYRHYVSIAGEIIAQIDVPENIDPASLSPIQGLERRYFVHDPVGSISLVLNHNGGVAERMYYDPWGRRRDALTGQSEGELSTSTGHMASRGYTLHEHLPSIGLIHMNGRLYDPLLGRFIQADSQVPDPSNLQSYNRYAYVKNNPLRYSDPTGQYEFDSLGGGGYSTPGFQFTLTNQSATFSSSMGSSSRPESGFSTSAIPIDTSIGPSNTNSGTIGSVPDNSAFSRYIESSNTELHGLGNTSHALGLSTFGLPRSREDASVSSYLFNESGPLSKVEQAVSNWLSASKAGVQSETSIWSAFSRGIQGMNPIEGIAAGVLGSIGKFDSATRAALKAEAYLSRNAPEVKRIFDWGSDLVGVQAARAALDANRMTLIQNSMTRSEVEVWRTFYNTATAQGRGGAVAPERAAYMADILKRW
jgi:RHS repeat-associated protein